MIDISNPTFINTCYDYFTEQESGEMLAVDKTTGEVSHAIVCAVPEGSKIYTPAQQRAYKQKQEAESKRYFARLNERECPLGNYYFLFSGEQFEELTPETVTRLIFLSTYMLKHNSNKLMLTERTPMRRKDLAAILGISESSARRFLREVSPNYLTTDKAGLIYTNTNIFKRGELNKHIDSHYLKMYIDGVRKLYKSAAISNHKQLGYLFKLLPFVNIEYNILCTNPLETDINKVKAISIEEFCKYIAYDMSNIQRLLNVYRKIRFDVNGTQERFCSFVYDGINRGAAGIIINPHIIYSGSDYKKVEALGVFHK